MPRGQGWIRRELLETNTESEWQAGWDKSPGSKAGSKVCIQFVQEVSEYYRG